jgi:hypothetical protein
MSIDMSSSADKIAFGIIKSRKTREYKNGNAAEAW